MKPRIDPITLVVALVAIGFGITACYIAGGGWENPILLQGTLALILIFSGAIGLLAVRPPKKRKEIR